MSTIEIKAQVDVTNQEQVEALNVFLKALGGQKQVENCEKPTTKQAPKKDVKEVKEVKEVKVKDAEVVAPETPVVVEETSTENQEADIKIEDVRALLSKKVTNNREAIKDKLTALGANNVTSLDKGKYQDFVDFLNGLA